MALFSSQLGIDLGTTYTLVFVPGKGVVKKKVPFPQYTAERKKLKK
jgi:actin-like ATPase involved in cell morphogenesis